MMLVQPGQFIMGSEGKEAYDNEQPEHLVAITQPFYIGIYPVTQAIWKTVLKGHNPSYFKGDRRPIERVSWTDIVTGGQDRAVPIAFLEALKKDFPIPKTANIPSNFQFRLPTEAEWEYAAKGGHLAEQKDLIHRQAAQVYTHYAGSDKLKEVAWFGTNSHRETKEVGQKRPNELGLYDMAGNVWEWVYDWHDENYYATSTRKNPQGPSEGEKRVMRGGAWSREAGVMRSAYRGWIEPWVPVYSRGFRCSES